MFGLKPSCTGCSVCFYGRKPWETRDAGGLLWGPYHVAYLDVQGNYNQTVTVLVTQQKSGQLYLGGLKVYNCSCGLAIATLHLQKAELPAFEGAGSRVSGLQAPTKYGPALLATDLQVKVCRCQRMWNLVSDNMAKEKARLRFQ